MDHPHATAVLVMRMYPGTVQRALEALHKAPIPGELHPYPSELMVPNVSHEPGSRGRKASKAQENARVPPRRDPIREVRSDNIFVVREESSPLAATPPPIVRAIVVEVQQGSDKAPELLLLYQCAAAVQLDCGLGNVELLFVTSSEETAARARRPFKLGRDQTLALPLVLGPDSLPLIRTTDQDPLLTILSALIHLPRLRMAEEKLRQKGLRSLSDKRAVEDNIRSALDLYWAASIALRRLESPQGTAFDDLSLADGGKEESESTAYSCWKLLSSLLSPEVSRRSKDMAYVFKASADNAFGLYLEELEASAKASAKAAAKAAAKSRRKAGKQESPQGGHSGGTQGRHPNRRGEVRDPDCHEAVW